MTAGFFDTNPRRAVLLGAATVLLHYLALAWVAPRLASAPAAEPAQPPPVTLVAPLAAAPRTLPVAAPPQVRPLLPPPLPVPGLEPLAVAPLPQEVVQVAAEQPAMALVRDEQETRAVPAVAEQAEPPAEAVAPPAAPPARYKVDMPPSAAMTLAVARRDADGTRWSGEAVMAWTVAPGRYSVRMEAGIRLVVARVNLAVLGSEGLVDEHGFAPLTLTEKRRGRDRTATRFDHEQKRITFSGGPRTCELLPGAQDKASAPLQLAAIARADPAQLAGGIDFQVAGEKDATLYRFVVVGEEEIETGLGRMRTLRLSRPPRPGAYNSSLDIWLAPALGWYPVQLRNTEASGAVTTQTVSKIAVTDLER